MKRWHIGAALVLAAGAAAFIWWRSSTLAPQVHGAETAATNRDSDEQRVLYWYDPMVPDKHFDKPGKSPFMDMQLVPKYAEEDGSGIISINPRMAQNLGMR